jgi:hypothetical protein
MAFLLEKWYLDVVSPSGEVAIAYWGCVRSGPLRCTFSGVRLGTPGAQGAWRFSLRGVAPPVAAGGSLGWRAAPLGVHAQYRGREKSFGRRLLEMEAGVLDWRCVVPGAAARFEIGERVVEGVGYAERLTLGFHPWKIPADEVRWGRFLSADVTLVWIDWRGAHPQRLVFRNGRGVEALSLDDRAIALSDGAELRLTSPRLLGDEDLGGMLAPLRPLRALLAPLARTRQARWLSWGELQGQDGALHKGWAVHERVVRG